MTSTKIFKMWWNSNNMKIWRIFFSKKWMLKDNWRGTLRTKNMPFRTPLRIRRKKTSHSKVNLLNHILHIQKSINILHILLLGILPPLKIMSLLLLHLNPNLRKKEIQQNVLNVWNMAIILSIVQRVMVTRNGEIQFEHWSSSSHSSWSTNTSSSNGEYELVLKKGWLDWRWFDWVQLYKEN